MSDDPGKISPCVFTSGATMPASSSRTIWSAWLSEQGHEAVDHGPSEYDAEDDYPPFCLAAAEAVVADPGSLGIVIGGSGNGEQIAANKVDGVRAALAWSTETAELARLHNNANVVSIGARMHTTEEATSFVRDLPDHRLHRRDQAPETDRLAGSTTRRPGRCSSADA